MIMMTTMTATLAMVYYVIPSVCVRVCRTKQHEIAFKWLKKQKQPKLFSVFFFFIWFEYFVASRRLVQRSTQSVSTIVGECQAKFETFIYSTPLLSLQLRNHTFFWYFQMCYFNTFIHKTYNLCVCVLLCRWIPFANTTCSPPLLPSSPSPSLLLAYFYSNSYDNEWIDLF